LPTLRDGSSQESGNPLVISVDKDQNIFLGDRIVALSDLNILLGNMRSEPLEQSLVLDCHREIPIEFVLELMGEVKNAGYPNIIFRHNKTDN
ncbi:MAG: biopolymer transporter ExbD, partial [Spirochaetales bacterium]|nr:biopolymer transporter ExbD [Spirochaetales bacterium]